MKIKINIWEIEKLEKEIEVLREENSRIPESKKEILKNQL